MFDGVFRDGLPGQRRQAEPSKRHIIVHDEQFLKLRLLHREIGAGVLQLL